MRRQKSIHFSLVSRLVDWKLTEPGGREEQAGGGEVGVVEVSAGPAYRGTSLIRKRPTPSDPRHMPTEGSYERAAFMSKVPLQFQKLT